MSDDRTSAYRQVYSPEALTAKLSRYARAAGREVVEKAVLLYQVLRNPGTPVWAKTTIIGALGYFVAPIDAIPDLIPGVGYSDDLGVLVMALTAVAASVTPEMRVRARGISERWFGESREVVAEDGPVIETEATIVARQPR